MSIFKQNIINQIGTREDLLIDTHTHIGMSFKRYVKSSGQFCQSLNELSMKMQLYGVDYSIVFPFPSLNGNMIRNIRINAGHNFFEAEEFPYQLANSYLFSEIVRCGYQEFIPFMLINTNIQLDEQLSFFERYEDYIFVIKIHTASNEISPEKLPEEFVSFCEKKMMPIIFHTRSCEAQYSCWSVLKFAEKNPNINVCVAHCAGFEKSFFEEVNNFDNVYFDVSPLLSLCHLSLKGNENVISKDKLDLDYTNPVKVLEDVYKLAPNHILWATDEPCGHYVDNKYQIQVNHVKDLDTSMRRQLQKNVFNFLTNL